MTESEDDHDDRACVLFSGGLESAYLLHQVSRDRDVLPAYVRFGFVWEDAEYEHACDFANAVGAREPHELRAPVDDVYPDFWGFTRDGVPEEARRVDTTSTDATSSSSRRRRYSAPSKA